MTQKQKEVSLVLITPELAEIYLKQNATNNRATRKSQVDLYASYMKNGSWASDNCAITFDVNGNLIDGQHRLQGIINSGVAQEFIVGKNWPIESMVALDMGKGRSFTDRLVVAGTPITAAECDILRSAMTNYASSQKGTQYFSRFGSEHHVEKQYARHSEITHLLAARYKNRVSKLVIGAAVQGYAQATLWYEKGKFSDDPLQRVLDFLDIVADGGSAARYNPNTDQAAMKLREQIQAKKAAGRNWYDMQDYRTGVTALAKFFLKKPQKTAIRPLEKPPFEMLQNLPGTNT